MTGAGDQPATGFYTVVDELETQKNICDFLAAHPRNIVLEADLKVVSFSPWCCTFKLTCSQFQFARGCTLIPAVWMLDGPAANIRLDKYYN